ncbi:MAG: TetR/AcrR family transcriptional regulator [Dehalococcoidia bacterium]|nr:TetR/AcrR family transcriptional regulator [Dehalococcoidia bacterium]
MVASPGRSDALANRSRLIEAARQVFAERGFEAEMKEIAARAGVGVGTIYRNFATKEDLAEAVVERLLDEAPALAAEALATEAPADGVLLLLQSMWDGFEQYGWLFDMLFVRSGRELEQEPAFRERLAAFVPVFARAQAAGALRSDLDPTAMVVCLRSLFYAYRVLRQERGPEYARKQLQALFLVGVVSADEGSENRQTRLSGA